MRIRGVLACIRPPGTRICALDEDIRCDTASIGAIRGVEWMMAPMGMMRWGINGGGPSSRWDSGNGRIFWARPRIGVALPLGGGLAHAQYAALLGPSGVDAELGNGIPGCCTHSAMDTRADGVGALKAGEGL